MKSMRSLILLLSIAIMIPAFAASPDLKDWDRSPQSCFMTKAEHGEWNTLKTPEEKQHFVDQFLAKRGPGFAAEVATRAAKADQYLTIGKLPGSRTLRGKLVIVFGPPTATDVSDIPNKGGSHHDSPAMANALSGGSGGGDMSNDSRSSALEDVHEGASSLAGATVTRDFHFTFASSPSGPLEVAISADPNSGKDWPSGREDAKRLDAAFEAAAQASIKTK
jgi:GWxTD domain-containing protein